jgi:hypothetical protein
MSEQTFEEWAAHVQWMHKPRWYRKLRNQFFVDRDLMCDSPLGLVLFYLTIWMTVSLALFGREYQPDVELRTWHDWYEYRRRNGLLHR